MTKFNKSKKFSHYERENREHTTFKRSCSRKSSSTHRGTEPTKDNNNKKNYKKRKMSKFAL